MTSLTKKLFCRNFRGIPMKRQYFVLFGISTFFLTFLYKVGQSNLVSFPQVVPINEVPPSVKAIIEFQRKEIRENLAPLFETRQDLDKFLQDSTIQTNGKPLINMVVTSWRSGSTFLGEIINYHPGDYHHYEALLPLGIVRVRDGSLADEALGLLNHLFKCNYSGIDSYIDFGVNHTYLHSHNTRLWRFCQLQPDLCTNPQFLGLFCSLFPYQSLKTVRLSLHLAGELIKDESLNMKVLHLVRDPRGSLQSRKHREWCPGNPDCDDPRVVCQDMVSDYNTAAMFLQKYPRDFQVMRYEDLSLNPHGKMKEVYEHFRLLFTPKVEKFLDVHTLENIGGVSSTFRNSKSAPFTWRYRLSPEEILDIQKHCSQALDLWGYNLWDGSSGLSDFVTFRPLNFSL